MKSPATVENCFCNTCDTIPFLQPQTSISSTASHQVKTPGKNIKRNTFRTSTLYQKPITLGNRNPPTLKKEIIIAWPTKCRFLYSQVPWDRPRIPGGAEVEAPGLPDDK